MSGTDSHPAHIPADPLVLADPLPVLDQTLVTLTGQHVAVTQAVVDTINDGIAVTASPVDGRPKVYGGQFYCVASGSQNETDLNNSGIGFISDQFDSSVFTSFSGLTVQSCSDITSSYGATTSLSAASNDSATFIAETSTRFGCLSNS